MSAPLTTPQVAHPVLFASQRESSVRMDSTILRSLGVTSVTHIAESAKLVDRLEKRLKELVQPQQASAGQEKEPLLPYIVICDEQLADISAVALLQSLSQNEKLKQQPVLVLTGWPKSTQQFRNVGAYVLERPYTSQQLARMIAEAMAHDRRILQPEKFTAHEEKIAAASEERKAKQAARPLTTSDWLKMGVACLRKGELPTAEHAFLQVLDRQSDHVDAHLGMAGILRTQENERGARKHLVLAAAACLRNGNRRKGIMISNMLPQAMRENIFSFEGMSYMQDGEFTAAALSFVDAVRCKTDLSLHTLLARACQLSPNPEENLTHLCRAYERMGHMATAKKIRHRLLTYTRYTPDDAPEGLLANYPKLKEAVDIASYSAWAWRNGTA